MQKQPSKGFFKESVMRNFADFTREHLCRDLLFNKLKLCRSSTSLKMSLQRWCFLVNFVKILITTFFTEQPYQNKYLQDVFKTCLQEVFKTCLQDVFSVTIFHFPRALEDVFKTSSRPPNVCWVNSECGTYLAFDQLSL